MNTTDDTLIREVDEDLRREHWAKLWKRYGALVVGGAAALVLSVAGHQGWRSYQRGIAEDAGQHFAEAEALGARDPAQATAAFAAVSADAPHGYALLARLHEAPGRATAGDTAAAQRLYAQIAADAGEPVYRDLATLLGVLAVLARPGEAITDAAALRARIEPLAAPDNPWRFSAQEVLAMLALDAGDRVKAKEILERLRADAAAPADLRTRADQLYQQLDKG